MATSTDHPSQTADADLQQPDLPPLTACGGLVAPYDVEPDSLDWESQQKQDSPRQPEGQGEDEIPMPRGPADCGPSRLSRLGGACARILSRYSASRDT